jgi:hypothetical protein
MKHTILLLIMPLLLLSSCGSADKAEKTADKFFAHIRAGRIQKAASMTSVSVPNSLLTQQLEELRSNAAGTLKSAKKGMGFNTQMVNGTTTVTLPYVLTYDTDERSVDVVLVDQGDGFKIFTIN